MAEANLPAPARTRESTGGILPPEGKRRSWTLRFRADGRRRHVTLGTPEEGWTRRRAEAALADTLAEVRLGVWHPEKTEVPSTQPEREAETTFHVYASEWLARREPELRESTATDYRWRLSAHLLPFFAAMPLEAIKVADVNRFRESKVRERDELTAEREAEAQLPAADRRRLPRPLANGSINKMIRLLAAILEDAVEEELLDRNVAKGRKRLLRESRPTRSFLQPPQVVALLDAAAGLDADARRSDTGRRRALMATLALGGLRIGEALNLRWRDVSLGSQRLRVRAAKTDAGVRDVALSPALLEALSEYRTRTDFADPDDLVFGTAKGRRDSESNVRSRFLAAAVEAANRSLATEGGDAIGAITPHSLRRTFISLLLLAGVDLRRVMAEVGHADPKMTLGVYAQVMTIEADFGPTLEALVGRGYRAEPGRIGAGAAAASSSAIAS